jgi:hypothetical protein
VKLLPDNHLPTAVADALRRAGIDVVTLAEWRGGTLRQVEDELILARAADDERVFVTYDCKTVPRLLIRWAAEGRTHAGVLLIDEKSIRQNDRRGLIRALSIFVANHGDEEWRDQVMYVPRA